MCQGDATYLVQWISNAPYLYIINQYKPYRGDFKTIIYLYMANWISIKDAAQKYDTTEENICELIRLRYIAFSYLNDDKLGGNYRDKLLMIDADEINIQLDINVVETLKEGEEKSPVVRIPLEELKDLLEINDELREKSDAVSYKLALARKGERIYGVMVILLTLLILYICRNPL